MISKAVVLFCMMIPVVGFGQNYDTEQLKTISTIWGETYLFHPSIIRSDKTVEWEKALVSFLPHLKNMTSTEEFVKVVNSELLAKLKDPFTVLQPKNESVTTAGINIKANQVYDYLKITEDELANIGSITTIDSLISDRTSEKPLLVDLRITKELEPDWHSNTLFDYFAAMLIGDGIPSSVSVSREHFGWDEYNDWWFYEQRWTVNHIDRQLSDNGRIKPLAGCAEEIRHYIPDFDFEEFQPILRPVYLLTNNSFLSFYESLILSLQTNRSHLFVLNENSGPVFTSGNPNLITYPMGESDFILNTGFYLNKGNTELAYGLNVSSIKPENIISFINSDQSDPKQKSNYSLEIQPVKYDSPKEVLSKEEKILGIIKTWTVVKYFYAHPELCSINWDCSLGKFLEQAQNTSSDQEYYTVIQEIMATLNDSHVSTFHPSILNFSEIFVAPINFEYIGGRVIVTAIDSSVQAEIHEGDEISSIDGFTIAEILQKEKRTISSCNEKSLIATVINPGYFVGAEGSIMELGVKKGAQPEIIEVPRTTYVFQFMGFGDHREASQLFEKNIGYLNLASLMEADQLESELKGMQNTKALIIDLRSSYPSADFGHFLQLLCKEKSTIRIDEVPVISAHHNGRWQKQVTNSEMMPDPSFTYDKPVAVLIDKTMISRPEDIAIALKSFSNVTFIGEQTQGTDGERTKIHLPGGGETSFTGQVVKFGNGENFQGIGILPDIEVIRTIDGVKNAKDEILEKAIEFLKTR